MDTVGRPNVKMKSFGKVGGETGSSSKKSSGESMGGVGGDLKGQDVQDEPIFHEAAYRSAGKDANWEKKPETGVPRQEASYQLRDRQGSGVEQEPKYQSKLRSYPTSSPKTKKSTREDV